MVHLHWGHGQSAGVGECVLDIVHGRDRMTIRPSHPYNPGTEHVGFSPTPQTLLAPSAKRREVFGSRLKGELHPTENRSKGGLAYG